MNTSTRVIWGGLPQRKIKVIPQGKRRHQPSPWDIRNFVGSDRKIRTVRLYLMFWWSPTNLYEYRATCLHVYIQQPILEYWCVPGTLLTSEDTMKSKIFFLEHFFIVQDDLLSQQQLTISFSIPLLSSGFKVIALSCFPF